MVFTHTHTHTYTHSHTLSLSHTHTHTKLTHTLSLTHTNIHSPIACTQGLEAVLSHVGTVLKMEIDEGDYGVIKKVIVTYDTQEQAQS